MTKEEYIKNNKYLRKAIEGLQKEDYEYMQGLVDGTIVIDEKDLRLKQILFHMSQNFHTWEIPGLIKSFKTLMKL